MLMQMIIKDDEFKKSIKKLIEAGLKSIVRSEVQSIIKDEVKRLVLSIDQEVIRKELRICIDKSLGNNYFTSKPWLKEFVLKEVKGEIEKELKECLYSHKVNLNNYVNQSIKKKIADTDIIKKLTKKLVQSLGE